MLPFPTVVPSHPRNQHEQLRGHPEQRVGRFFKERHHVDSRELVGVLGPQDAAWAVSLFVNAADMTGALDGGAQLIQRQS